MDKLNKNFNKEKKTNKKPVRMKNSVTEMKNILEGISRLEDAEKQTTNLEGRVMKTKKKK